MPITCRVTEGGITQWEEPGMSLTPRSPPNCGLRRRAVSPPQIAVYLPLEGKVAHRAGDLGGLAGLEAPCSALTCQAGPH